MDSAHIFLINVIIYESGSNFRLTPWLLSVLLNLCVPICALNILCKDSMCHVNQKS